MERLRIGCRDNALAVIHAKRIMQKIKRADSSCQLDMVTVAAAEEQVLELTEETAHNGTFAGELDRALLDGSIDLAVCDLGKLPPQLPPGISIAAYSARSDAKDTLVLPRGAEHPDMERPIGASGAHRRMQAGVLYPRFDIAPIRGDIQSRLKRLDCGDYSALILSCDALARLGIRGRSNRVFSEQEIVPLAGQGILAVMTRENEVHDCLSGVDDFFSRCCAKAERTFIESFEDICNNPVAAFAQIQDNEMQLTVFYSDGERSCKRQLTGPLSEARKLGERLAGEVKQWYEHG